MVMLEGTTFKEQATYSCNTGFSLVGDSVRTCLASGAWSGSPPECQIFTTVVDRETTSSVFTTVVDRETTSSPGITTESSSGFTMETSPDFTMGRSLVVYIGVAIGAAAVLVAILLFALLVIWIYHRRRRKVDATLKSENEKFTKDEKGRSTAEANATEEYHLQSRVKFQVPQHLTISSENLKLGKILGQGEFGIVYRARLKRGFHDNLVAVKTLKGFLDQSNVDDLLKECTKMSEFDHPNVLTLTGVCLDGGPAPFIIMPFMEIGSLLSYLKEERDNLVLEPDTNEDVEPLTRKLLDICVQIAKGMEYLASKRVIHRDLAARNCMIGYNYVIKVADFGLSESIDTSKQYYRQDKQVVVRLPIKWLAPESISESIFSEKTDMWSYGVTCWEVFSGGKSPYPGIHPVDMSYHLEKGHHLKKPHNRACSDQIFSLMVRCWEGQPGNRPTFAEMVLECSFQLQGLAGYLKLIEV